ncbi:hypothetical protein DP939_22080 [Spongiactinospora rosea]|uniref:Lactococcin 972 family bacteriocin n=1 Tax=Spongiactinospora rosea TaxID=2248750 RepID=A0A366LVT3_9ACTN|nr:hypothetical protein DP939_22080 [Spongiactinospora rosea]
MCLSTLLISTVSVTPSQASAFAGPTFDWGAGKYHASSDFVPGASKIQIGGAGGSGGSAKQWYTQLVRTTDKKKILSTYSYPTDGQNHTHPPQARVATNTAYYLRWYGQDKNENNGKSAPWAKAYARW